MKALLESEIKKLLTNNLKEWFLEKKVLKKDFNFKSFVEAFSFMTAIALEAEKLNHHPDWSNVYNRVSINLTTHEANGVTQLDLDLASTIDGIYKIYN